MGLGCWGKRIGDAKCKVGSAGQLTMPSSIGPGRGLWGPRLSILCPAPGGGPKASAGPHPPTYAVKTYQHLSSDQRWTAKLNHFKSLLRLRRRSTFFAIFIVDQSTKDRD